VVEPVETLASSYLGVFIVGAVRVLALRRRTP
jgi:hypothetical protein